MLFRTESRLGCSICDFYLHEYHRIQYVFRFAWVTFLCVDRPRTTLATTINAWFLPNLGYTFVRRSVHHPIPRQARDDFTDNPENRCNAGAAGIADARISRADPGPRYLLLPRQF